MVRNKDRTRTPSPILSLLLMIKFSPSLSITLLENGTEEVYNQSMTDPLSSFLLLTLFLFSSIEPLPTRYSLHKLLLCGFPTGSRKPVPDRKRSYMGSSPWAAAPAKILLWHELFRAGGSFRISPPATIWGSQWAALWIPDPLWSSTATLLCSTALLPPLPLVCTEQFLRYFSNSLLLRLLCSIFYPFLTAFPKMSLLSVGLSCGTWLCPAVSLACSSPKPPHRCHPWSLSHPLTTKMWTYDPNNTFLILSHQVSTERIRTLSLFPCHKFIVENQLTG